MSNVNERGFDRCLASKAKNVRHSGKRKGHTWRSDGTWPVRGGGWSPSGTGKAQHVTSLSSGCPRPGRALEQRARQSGLWDQVHAQDSRHLTLFFCWEGGTSTLGEGLEKGRKCHQQKLHFYSKAKGGPAEKAALGTEGRPFCPKEEWTWEPACPEAATCCMSKASQVPSLNTHR